MIRESGCVSTAAARSGSSKAFVRVQSALLRDFTEVRTGYSLPYQLVLPG